MLVLLVSLSPLYTILRVFSTKTSFFSQPKHIFFVFRFPEIGFSLDIVSKLCYHTNIKLYTETATG